MPNSSATGGYLLPTNPILDGQALKDFIHDFLVGLTAIDNTLVRPAFQRNPIPAPDIDIDWLAFNISERRITNVSGLFYIGETLSQLIYEDLDVVCYFYGTDSTLNASIARDAVRIGQNREVLFLNGFGLRGTSDIRYMPEFINEQFHDRCDVTITLTREIVKNYEILSVESAEGSLAAETNSGQAITNNWEV